MKSIFWLTQTSEQVSPTADWLSEGEKAVLAGLRFPKRRNDWLLGRWTAKQAICTFLKNSASEQSLEIRAAEDGAPEAFWRGEPAEVSISISHSRGRSICAVAPGSLSIGCDLEWIEPREETFAEDYFTAEEMGVILGSPLERSLIVNLIWSAKEAALKVVRTGLSRDTRSVVITPDFSAPEGGWNKFSGHCLESSGIFHGWWQTGEGYVYTIASSQPTAFPKELIL